MAKTRKPYVNVDITNWLPRSSTSKKRKIVMHETVSHDHKGLTDIISIAKYLGAKGLGIHSIVDQEGKSGYSQRERAVYYHAKGDNTNSIGIELVSFIPGLNIGRWARLRIWLSRERQLHKAARWVAYYADQHDIPLWFSAGKGRGVTSHYNISKAYGISGGHWDCWPKHQGGHFPMKRLIRLAKGYKSGSLAYRKINVFKLGKSV